MGEAHSYEWVLGGVVERFGPLTEDYGSTVKVSFSLTCCRG